MNYFPVGVTDEQFSQLVERQEEMLALQKEQERKRRFALALGAAGALLAAARLGIVAVPLIKARRAR